MVIEHVANELSDEYAYNKRLKQACTVRLHHQPDI
jgi:hypothetical protein